MAFFKFRKAGDDTATVAAPAESVEVLRRRARHRLIGAAVLVLVGVIGFPLLFDTQPRPVPVDIAIDIPDRTKAKPLAAPATPVQTPMASGAVSAATPHPPASAARMAVSEGLDAKEQVVSTAPAARPVAPPAAPPAAPPVAAAPAKVAKAEPKVEPKPEPKPEPRPAAKADDGARARALLEGKTDPAGASKTVAASEGRFVVQVGAFSDVGKARETRLKVERAGLKTYTQVVETREGKRIRVRVGPFASKAEADRAADKIKGLDLPAAILTL